MKYDERKEVIENIKGVIEVIPQDTLDQVSNILKVRPEYVVHGDDWKEGQQKELRENVINALNTYGGKLIEVPYTKGVSISKLDQDLMEIGITPQMRMKSLKELIYSKKPVRILEAHNGLTGLIVEKLR